MRIAEGAATYLAAETPRKGTILDANTSDQKNLGTGERLLWGHYYGY